MEQREQREQREQHGDDGTAAGLRREADGARALVAGLEADLAGVVEASRDSNADDEHDPDGATIAFERAQLQTVLAHARARVLTLGAALERLGSGTYAVCEGCGGAIAPARLEARPGVTRCIACARLAERA